MYTNKVIWYTKTAILIFKATQPILWKAMFNFKPIFFLGGGREQSERWEEIREGIIGSFSHWPILPPPPKKNYE
jgi:hypothetical protein